jgi:hypothetical protein
MGGTYNMHMGRNEKWCSFLLKKPESNTSCCRPKRKWKEVLKLIYVTRMVLGQVNLMGIDQLHNIVNTVADFSGNTLNGWAPISFQRIDFYEVSKK